MASGIVLLDSPTGREIILKHCKKEGIEITVLEDLVSAELDQVGKRKKRGINERFDEILDQTY